MSTEQAENTPTKKLDCDWFLQVLVGMVNDSDVNLTMGITLTFGGTVISGDLISYKKYFAKFGDAYAGGFEGLNAESRKSIAEQFAPKDQSANAFPQFIHIDNAVIVDSGGLLPAEAARHKSLWRGRLATVSGFMLGKMS